MTFVSDHLTKIVTMPIYIKYSLEPKDQWPCVSVCTCSIMSLGLGDVIGDVGHAKYIK